ncbi:glycosyltransferase [Mesorhizobium sp. M0923]|uniref:CgeB family protein n=1 Tax=Mesorhizobium sp. M0923 TaxID=2957028 RepID=UPI003337539A
MKAVFVAQLGVGDTGAGLAQGFRELDWAVQDVDIRQYIPRATKAWQSRLAARLLRGSVIREYQNTVLDVCRSFRPDVMITVKGDAISSQTVTTLRTMGIKNVLFYPDVDFDHPGVDEEKFREFDLIVTTKSFHIPYLERKLGSGRVAFVPHGFSPAVHRPIYRRMSDSERTSDVLYAGNHSAYKQLWLENLIRANDRVGLTILGSRWKQRILKSPLYGQRVLGALHNAAYAEAIQGAKINIAVHFGKTKSGWEDLVSKRSFEIPACMGFMLHIDNPEIRELFDVGREIDVFSSVDELSDKIDFYLARPDLRADMIERAFRRAVPGYSFSSRAEQIVSLLRDSGLTG